MVYPEGPESAFLAQSSVSEAYHSVQQSARGNYGTRLSPPSSSPAVRHQVRTSSKTREAGGPRCTTVAKQNALTQVHRPSLRAILQPLKALPIDGDLGRPATSSFLRKTNRRYGSSSRKRLAPRTESQEQAPALAPLSAAEGKHADADWRRPTQNSGVAALALLPAPFLVPEPGRRPLTSPKPNARDLPSAMDAPRRHGEEHPPRQSTGTFSAPRVQPVDDRRTRPIQGSP